jgi:signal transduction histidine kinase
MSHEQLLISSKAASRRQVTFVALVGLTLLGVFAASAPYRLTPFAPIASFIPVVDTLLLLGDLLTATLLFAQASVLRSRALLALATGYFFTGLLIVPHALTFPHAFAAEGLLGANVSTALWLLFFWHAGLPLAVIAYATLKRTAQDRPVSRESLRRTMALCIAGSAALVAVLTVLAVSAPLPALMTDATNWLPARVNVIAFVLIGLIVAAMTMVGRGPRSLLDWWLLLAMWAWLIELLLIVATSARYTGGWYLGRTAALLSGVLVLLMLLAETNRLYARLALSWGAEQRERENRLLTLKAVTAAIAHEVKQPLTAVVANAAAISQLLKRRPTALGDIGAILDCIVQDAHRAGQVVDGVRTIFTDRPAGTLPLNLNDLLCETMALIPADLQDANLSLQLELHDALPPVPANRLQLQQVFLNLFVNALEAMRMATGRTHTLGVRSTPTNEGSVVVSVEDSGVGIVPADAELIFEAFFTTKSGGTGLGLPLCRSIVEAHGGRVWATPRIPFGAAFHVQLPLADNAQ